MFHDMEYEGLPGYSNNHYYFSYSDSFFLNLLLCDYMASTPSSSPEITFFFFSLSGNCSGVSIKRQRKYVSK